MHTGSKRNEIFLTVTHYLTALVVLLKGISKISSPGKWWIGLLFIAIALFLVFGTLFHHRFEKMLRHFKGYTFVLESIVLALVGYMYVKEGKHFLPYVCFLASALYIVALVVYIIGNRRKALNASPSDPGH